MADSMHTGAAAMAGRPFGMRSGVGGPMAGGGVRGLARTSTAAGGMALVFAFVLGLVLPIEASLNIGTVRLSPYRIVLLVALFPCVSRMLTGKAGKLMLIDALIFLYAAWATVALFVNHNLGLVWEFAGSQVIESVVPYMLARCYIRSVEDFQAFVRFVLLIIIALVPVAAYESLTGNILRPTELMPEPRLGLHRAFGPFEHPILYGVFCGSMFGIAFFALKGTSSTFTWMVRCAAIGLATFFSLSAGPFVALAAQLGLIAWSRVMRNVRQRWLLLAGCFAAGWVFVSMMSNRTPVEVFITYFTFNVGNAWNRIHIWNFGTQSIVNNPLFGKGMHEWERGWWMSTSMDNFWLVEAVRYGLPALILLAAAVLMLCFRIGRRDGLEPRAANCRMGWMVTMVGLIFAGATVHYWHALFAFFFFLAGAGVWLLNAPAARADATQASSPPAAPNGLPAASARPRRGRLRGNPRIS